MEKNYEDKDNLLARWLSGDLTDLEKKDLEASGEAEVLRKIVNETDRWTMPDLKPSYYAQLEERIKEKREAKVIPLYRNKTIMSIAASLLLIIGLSVSYSLFFSANYVSYQCDAGQQLNIYLPDKTLVTLHGQSSIRYDETDWMKEGRNVELNGEAYFEVTKKGPFQVSFGQGTVSVLGTRFNIMSGKDIATVKCYEGRVAVGNGGEAQQELTKGMAARLRNGQPIDTFSVADNAPDWSRGENIFRDAPLIEVINALSIQFNTPFEIGNTIDLNRKFTGKFIHTDLETALNMVFTPMGITYTVEGEKRKTVTLK